MPTVRAKPAWKFIDSIGINIHASYFQTNYGDGDFVYSAIKDLGIKHVRDGSGVTDNVGWMNRVYGLLKRLPVKLNLVNCNDVLTVLNYFNPDYLEGLNELDLRNLPDWPTSAITFQNKIWEISTLSNSIIYGPAAGRAANSSRFVSLPCDYGSIHPYPGGSRPLNNLAQWCSYYGIKPLVATESGYHNAMKCTINHPAVSEEAASRYIPRMFCDYFSSGIVRTYLYELFDQGDDQNNKEMNFGLVRKDKSYKPAFYALADLIAELDDPGPEHFIGTVSYELTGDITNVRTLLLQKRDGQFYLIVYHDAFSFDKGVTQPVSKKKCKLTTKNYTKEIVVPDYPLIIKI